MPTDTDRADQWARDHAATPQVTTPEPVEEPVPEVEAPNPDGATVEQPETTAEPSTDGESVEGDPLPTDE